VAQWRLYARQKAYRNGAWDMNRLDMAELDLRRALAPALQQFYPHQSTCKHCSWPWGFVQAHDVELGDGVGCFFVCEQCFDHLKQYGLYSVYLGHMRTLFNRWTAESPEHTREWSVYEAAVRLDWHGPPVDGSRLDIHMVAPED
jgi:hypothetical protein